MPAYAKTYFVWFVLNLKMQRWETFKWYEPTMPGQPDGASCGVFVMKFMEEWDGVVTRLASFKREKKENLKKGPKNRK
ncbi:hypothetical protein LIER_37312 [Lithospermum erythrorhizon]|uniref:Ubiquitin-like protease family profile domain-containing protein n=1 Tax=Lithospermum erythrorhizon TaxID=34254 RepID=A0AAV3PK41_LITER